MAGRKGMKSQKAWLVPSRYKGGYLHDLDGRSPDVRGIRYVRACLESDLGGYDNISRMESSLVDRSAFLIYLAEEMELAVLRKKPIHVTEYLAVVNSLSGLLSRLGLKRKARVLTLKDYLSSTKPEPQPAPSSEPQHKKEN